VDKNKKVFGFRNAAATVLAFGFGRHTEVIDAMPGDASRSPVASTDGRFRSLEDGVRWSASPMLDGRMTDGRTRCGEMAGRKVLLNGGKPALRRPTVVGRRDK
jgi:hypothetical protein